MVIVATILPFLVVAMPARPASARHEAGDDAKVHSSSPGCMDGLQSLPFAVGVAEGFQKHIDAFWRTTPGHAQVFKTPCALDRPAFDELKFIVTPLRNRPSLVSFPVSGADHTGLKHRLYQAVLRKTKMSWVLTSQVGPTKENVSTH